MMPDRTTQTNVEQFLYREARLLDQGQFAEWLDLYAPDGIYWMPGQPGQTDPKNVASIIYEDYPILAIRVQRLFEARALVLTPMPQTTHILSNIEVEAADDGTLRAHCAFLCVEYQADRQKIFAGRQSFELVAHGDSFRIRFKRVDLLNAGGILPLITIPL
jgi:benzoate/toluate 1,2-dioxygenase beta subunit